MCNNNDNSIKAINVLLVGCITLLLLFAGKYNPDENKSYRRFELCRLDDRYIQQDTLRPILR